MGTKTLFGELRMPKGAQGLVLFAHGSGSGRHSPRNQLVARYLESKGLSTLLFDLLDIEEEAVDEVTRELRFDIPFLTKRLIAVTDWVIKESKLPVGYFGSSTGAAAALAAAAVKKLDVRAVVSRGGRPDLAMASLSEVTAPTLLIVGSLDIGVIELNEAAFQSLKCVKKMEIVPGATHLFEEEGKLERVAELAAAWFSRYLHPSKGPSRDSD